MKKIVLGLLSFSFYYGVHAQKQLDAFEAMDQVKSVVVNQKMFDLMAKVKMDDSDKEAAHYLSLLQKLDQLKLYATVDKSTALQMKTAVGEYVSATNLAAMSKITDSGNQISLFVKPGTSATELTEMLLFVEGAANEETVVFSLTGLIDLNEVAFLSERLKLPGKAAIQKAVQLQKK